jgi:SAM-dependent methyltransferase
MANEDLCVHAWLAVISQMEGLPLSSKDFPLIPAGQRQEWFHERYELAAVQILEFLSEDFVLLHGRDVADIGCGDGILDLGLATRARPSSLVGFDVVPTDTGLLMELAEEFAGPDKLPEGLSFRTCEPQRLPAADASFDVAVSWSAFHHLENPLSMLHEIRRILRPRGHLMIQLYPFYPSPHGSLLEPWFPDGFAHFLYDPDEIARRVRADPGPDPAWAEAMLAANRGLNRLTLDELGRFLAIAGFQVQRLSLIAEDTPVPPEVSGLKLSELGIAGVKLLAGVQ